MPQTKRAQAEKTEEKSLKRLALTPTTPKNDSDSRKFSQLSVICFVGGPNLFLIGQTHPRPMKLQGANGSCQKTDSEEANGIQSFVSPNLLSLESGGTQERINLMPDGKGYIPPSAPSTSKRKESLNQCIIVKAKRSPSVSGDTNRTTLKCLRHKQALPYHKPAQLSHSGKIRAKVRAR